MTYTGQTLQCFFLSALVILFTCFTLTLLVAEMFLHLTAQAELQKQSRQIINSNTMFLCAINYIQFMFDLKCDRFGEYILYYGRYRILGL